jgi:4-amino-4-deoxy-L-arabinose transferase-like glycosyltransferase
MKLKIFLFLKQNWLILFIWILGLILRCYRQTDLLGFYYDQGRDAAISADILSFKNFPAIGPTTGIAGLFLGPFWFYLITPGYLIGHGSPAIAAYFIAFLESLTIPLIFFLLKRYWNTKSAYLGAFIWAFSHYLIRSGRWFSNPSPLPTFVLLIIIVTLGIVIDKKYRRLPFLALLLGLSLQLEAASAVFFFPVLLLFFIFNKKNLNQIKFHYWLQSVLVFFALLLPQLAFEIKNKFLLSRNFIGFLTGRVNSDTGQSWAIPTLEFFRKRVFAYYQAFFSKLDTPLSSISLVVLIVFVLGVIYLFFKHRHSSLIRILLLWLFIPLLLLMFFTGNYGVLYDYYLTGFFPVFIMLLAIIITLPPAALSLFSVFTFIMYFIGGNFIHLKNYLIAGLDGPQNVVLGNELAAVKTACKFNRQIQGNLDIYVPPVIPYAYDYLVSWQQKLGNCFYFDQNQNQNLYLIYEVDPPHPERLSNWLSKYQSDPIVNTQRFGGVIFEQRLRH